MVGRHYIGGVSGVNGQVMTTSNPHGLWTVPAWVKALWGRLKRAFPQALDKSNFKYSLGLTCPHWPQPRRLHGVISYTARILLVKNSQIS